MHNTTNSGKSKGYILSEQVKDILQKRGFSAVFNYSDYQFFKSECLKAFNIAQEIADKFIQEANPQANDFNDYIF